MTAPDLEDPAVRDTGAVQATLDTEQPSQARLYPYTYEEAEDETDEAPGTEETQTAVSQQVVCRSTGA